MGLRGMGKDGAPLGLCPTTRPCVKESWSQAGGHLQPQQPRTAVGPLPLESPVIPTQALTVPLPSHLPGPWVQRSDRHLPEDSRAEGRARPVQRVGIPQGL